MENFRVLWGGSMKQIQFTGGCPNDCGYCYEPKEMKYYNPEIPKGEEEYKTKKKEALTRFNEKHKQMKEQRISPVLKNFSRAIMDLREEAKVCLTELGKRYDVSDSYQLCEEIVDVCENKLKIIQTYLKNEV